MASKFEFPKEWADEERMYFLMSPFPPNSFPTLSDPKVSFWKSLIYSSCRDLSRWSFTERELTDGLSWNGMQPKNLSVVISTLERAGEVQRLSNFQPKSWMEWGRGLITHPLSWAWQKYVAAAPESEEVYVIVSLIKEFTDLVLNEHFSTVLHAITDCVMSLDKFKELLQKVAKSTDATSLQALEYQLLVDQKITKAVSKETNEIIIKFAPSKSDKALPVTDIDIGIFNLMNATESLRKKMESLNSQSITLRKKCLEYKRNGDKKNALIHYKRIKSIANVLAPLEQQLANLETILEQIQTAETNSKVLKAYEDGVVALKFIREKEGLNLDRVENVMDDMKELVEEGEEINQIFGKDFFEFDEEELAKEFDNLVHVTDKVDLPKQSNLAVPVKSIEPITQTRRDTQNVAEHQTKTSKSTKLKPMLLS